MLVVTERKFVVTNTNMSDHLRDRVTKGQKSGSFCSVGGPTSACLRDY